MPDTGECVLAPFCHQNFAGLLSLQCGIESSHQISGELSPIMRVHTCTMAGSSLPFFTRLWWGRAEPRNALRNCAPGLQIFACHWLCCGSFSGSRSGGPASVELIQRGTQLGDLGWYLHRVLPKLRRANGLTRCPNTWCHLVAHQQYRKSSH